MSWQENIGTAHWQPGDELPSHNDSCMVCGGASVSSPLLDRWRVLAGGDQVGTSVRFDERHQGAPLYAHGGAVAALLDDAMGYVSFLVQHIFVTAHLEVDYRRPVLLGRDYDVVAWCLDVEGRKVRATAELRDGDTIIASGTGLFVVVDLEHFQP